MFTLVQKFHAHVYAHKWETRWETDPPIVLADLIDVADEDGREGDVLEWRRRRVDARHGARRHVRVDVLRS
jgi:hypothetical protein